jgi:hypothetical protein
VFEKGYASLKLYPGFSLHVSVVASEDEDENGKVDVLLIDYITIHVAGLEVFVAVHRDGRYKIIAKCYNKKIRKKITEGVGERIHVGDKKELDVFLDHFEIFIVKYLQQIVNEYPDVLPEDCMQLIRDILHYLQS